ERPSEVPAGAWDVAVFDNLFPSLSLSAPDPPALSVPTAPGLGVCEGVVFTPGAPASLAALSLSHLEPVLDRWAGRHHGLGPRPDIQYVYPFENRGVEVGVTLNHPHGQIYAYPFVPPVPARELEQQRLHYERHGTGLVEQMVAREIDERIRMLYEGPHAAA